MILLKPPELLTVTATNMPGVYLSSEEIFPSDKEIEVGEKKVYRLFATVDDLETLGVEGEINSLKIVN